MSDAFDAGLTDQTDLDECMPRHATQRLLGNFELGFFGVRAAYANNHLAGGNDLPRLRSDRGDDAGVVGTQLGVTEPIERVLFCQIGRFELGSRQLEASLSRIVVDLGGEAAAKQLALSEFLSAGVVELGARGSDIAFGNSDGGLLVRRVQPAQNCSFLHHSSNVDKSSSKFPGDAKADIRLITGLYFANCRTGLSPFDKFDLLGPHWTDCRCGH